MLHPSWLDWTWPSEIGKDHLLTTVSIRAGGNKYIVEDAPGCHVVSAVVRATKGERLPNVG